MFEGMDTSYAGGFVATQDTADRKNVNRGRGSPWIPVSTSDVRDLLPGQDSIRMGTLESSEVTLVGVVRSAERKLNTASIDYLIDDNTGPPLSVTQLIGEEREAPVIPVAEGTQVRVIGKVRTWGNQRGVTAFVVIPLNNLEEMTLHTLEVKFCKLFYSKDMLRRRDERAQNKEHSTIAAPAMMTGASAHSSTSKVVPNQPLIVSGLTGINAEIFKFLSTGTTETGYSVADLQRRFPHLGLPKIREHLELLASEGHVYTTVDDDHFRTTDS